MLVTDPTQHILQQQEDQFPAARGNFSSLLSGMTLATKMIQAKIRRAGLVDILGSAGAINVQGETQQKLDVYANQAVLHCLGARESVAFLVSEEDEQPITIDRSEGGKYIVVFDPLDGSSNIDVNVSVGTIFSILRRPDGAHGEAAVLQPGWKQVAAGYVVYGSSTIFVYTAGQGVYGFTLEPEIGAFVLSFAHMKMPRRARNTYSVATKPTPTKLSGVPAEPTLRGGFMNARIRVALYWLAGRGFPPHAPQGVAYSSIRRRRRTRPANCVCFAKANPLRVHRRTSRRPRNLGRNQDYGYRAQGDTRADTPHHWQPRRS